MIKRIIQFYRAVATDLTEEDTAFADKYLSAGEKLLFGAMHMYDKRHAVNVAYDAIKEAAGCTGVDMRLLIKAALLHDVGRTAEDTCLWDKVLAVVLCRICCRAAAHVAQKGRGGFWQRRRNALYVCMNHAAIGAARLEEIGSASAAGIVRRHHDRLCGADSRELVILRRADELN